MKDTNMFPDVTYQVSRDNHYNLVIHMINGDNVMIEPHHIEENLNAIEDLLSQQKPYYHYKVKGCKPYRTTFFTATKLSMLRSALASAIEQEVWANRRIS